MLNYGYGILKIELLQCRYSLLGLIILLYKYFIYIKL